MRQVEKVRTECQDPRVQWVNQEWSVQSEILVIRVLPDMTDFLV